MKYKIKKILYKVLHKDSMNLNIEYYRSKGVKIGKNVRTFSSLINAEPYLIEIGNNVTISTGVEFITHDNSVSKIIDDRTDVFGKIIIGDNCFVGANSILLPGVILGNNTIVGAGSVVTKSYLEGDVIIAGNPARIITTVDDYRGKIYGNSMNTLNMNYNDKKNYILKNEKLFLVK